MYSLSEQWTHILKGLGIQTLIIFEGGYMWGYHVATQNKNGAQYSLLKDFY